jgi:ABC-type branched-subunit amino acid transport system ATPase component
VPTSKAAAAQPALAIDRLDVRYGRAQAVQQASLALERGTLAIVGRNGMGKTSLCNAVTGMVPSTGSIRLFGEEIGGLPPHRITRRGIAYVPQGRRVWRSLTVDEHLRLAHRSKRGEWTPEGIYELFPRLKQRRHNGGMQLSGGEQQMLAIGRALLLDPSLLVMDEPTEGLAPIIVEQLAETLRSLAARTEMAILLVEQNLRFAVDVADTVAVMVNGCVVRTMPAAALASDQELQRQLMGVHAQGSGS